MDPTHSSTRWHVAGFDVLGVRFRIESNRRQALEPYAALLKKFRVPESDPSAPVLRLLVGDGTDAGAIEFDGHRFEIPGGLELLLAHAYSVLLHWVFGRVQNHFLLHGAALSHAGRGWVLCGASGTGKTTLVCALAAQGGWEFLSDDVAPLDFADGRLHPFPKALSLRPGIASEEQLATAIRLPVLEGGAKHIVQPEALGLRVGRDAVPLAKMIFMEPDAPEPRGEAGPLVVVVHRHVPGLLAEVGGLEDVQSVRERPGSGFVQFEIETRVAARCLSRVGELCRKSGALVIGTAREARRGTPDFEAQPVLTPLQTEPAIRLFLQRLWGTAQFRRLAELGGGAALYGRVAACLAGVRCYRLRPGRYDETLELLETLVPQD